MNFHRIYAQLNGYFWLPCPICGKFFGGHQTSRRTRSVRCKKRGGGHGHMTCPDHDLAENEWITVDFTEGDPNSDCNGCHGYQIGLKLGYISE